MGTAEEALRALARDLVEEISQARAVELAAADDPDELELAVFNVRPFSRNQRIGKTGKVVREQVRGHTEQRDDLAHPGSLRGYIPPDDWKQGQQSWKAKGEKIWSGHRWKDIDAAADARAHAHLDAAHAHLAPDDDSRPAFVKGYEHLHEAHRVLAEHLLPRAETADQKKSVRDAISHVASRMRDIDKAAGVRSSRTRRLTGSVPERSARAAERLAEGEQHPQVQPAPPALPPPPKGAQAVHPHLGHHVARLPGDTISTRAYSHVPVPVPVEAPSPHAQALEQANKRLEGYAKREENQRASDLRDHLAELRQADAAARAADMEARGQAAPGEYAPLTDEQFAAHVRDLEAAIDEALRAGKATEQQHSVNGEGYVWSPDRSLLHADIIREYLDKQVDVPAQRAALFVGGLPGAGKSSLLKNHPSGDLLKQYAVVNPDYFKAELAKRGMIPEVAGLSPLEASALAHEESAYLADLAANALQVRGKNLIFDVTMKNEGITRDRVKELKSHDYKVSAFLVDVPVEKSADRVVRRYRKNLEAYRKGTNPLGGRYVPRAVVLRGEDAPGKSRPRATFEALKPEFAHWELWDGTKGLPVRTAQGGPAKVPEDVQGNTIPSAEALRRHLASPPPAPPRGPELRWGDITRQYPQTYGGQENQSLGKLAAHWVFRDDPGKTVHDLVFRRETLDPAQLQRLRSGLVPESLGKIREGFSQPGHSVPPILVAYQDGKYRVVDGAHRAEVAAELGQPVNALVAYPPYIGSTEAEALAREHGTSS